MDASAGLTDLCLVAVAVGGAARVARPSPLAAAGLSLIGLAAALGTARFLALPDLATVHTAASHLAGAVGVPMLGAGAALAAADRPGRDRAALGVGLLLLVAGGLLVQVELYRVGAGALGMIAGLVAGVRRGAWPIVGGCVGVMAAGLVIAGEGSVAGLTRTGWFHLALAASVGAIAWGISGVRRAG